MNCNSFAALASPLVLALALACGGGSGSSTANTIVVTPTVTPASHLNYIGIGQNAQVSTQAQANCTYTWTVSGDAAASITAGQGSNAITITPTSAATANTSLHVSVTVQATAGSSSGTGSIDILEVLPPTPTVQNSTINDYVNPGQALTFTAAEADVTDTLAYAWSVTGGSITAGGNTGTVSVTTDTPGSFPGSLNAQCSVTATNTGVTATDSTALPIFNPNGTLPTTPVVTGPATARGGTTGLVYSTTAQPGCTYQWVVYSGEWLPLITSGQGTTSCTITAPAYGTASVAGTNTFSVVLTLMNGAGYASALVPLTVTL